MPPTPNHNNPLTLNPPNPHKPPTPLPPYPRPSLRCSREHSFTPNIGNASALVNEDRLRESSEERLQRLAYRDKDLILTSRQAAQTKPKTLNPTTLEP